MELVNDEDVETMVILYYSSENVNVELVQLFAELADMGLVQNDIPLNQPYGVQDPSIDVSRVSIERRLFIHKFNFDLNIHPEVVATDADGEEGPHNDVYSHHNDKDFSDFNLDNVSNDTNDEGVDDDDIVDAPFVRNLSRGIVICNDLRSYILSVDSDVVHKPKFPKYPNFEFDKLFVGQQFMNKEDYVFAIKWYNIKVLVNYKVFKSTSTLYVGEYWSFTNGCNCGYKLHLSRGCNIGNSKN
ncbi:hypothetical protein J1N35_007389 [Gossypium stocksii]|uniref:Transposase MuDR plant domain-containing protein n=1 Tax=Gossypium stocksii TaxID=47602 RepID=A0A9D3W6K1_9ROSI|nr:hypothetical protein J1N35_007389 [Gossypium stocksii]